MDAHGTVIRSMIRHWSVDREARIRFLEGFSVALELVRKHPEFAGFLALAFHDERPPSQNLEDFAGKMADYIVSENEAEQVPA